MKRGALARCTWWCLLVAPATVDAQEVNRQNAEADPRAPVIARLDSGRTVSLFPPRDAYPDYVADPHRPGFALNYLHMLDPDIAETGKNRFQIKLGGALGLLQISSAGADDLAWQVNLVAAFDGQFDVTQSEDNIGWDGYYGALATTALNDDWALKLGIMHLSSHVGDEYMQRTGRQRIGYTREELVAAATYSPEETWQVYVEGGYGYGLRSFQAPGRLQTGVQNEWPAGFQFAPLHWYAALNLTAFEERDWRADWSVALGLRLSVGDRVYRLGLAWVDGRPTVGEFFQATERYVSLGISLDI